MDSDQMMLVYEHMANLKLVPNGIAILDELDLALGISQMTSFETFRLQSSLT